MSVPWLVPAAWAGLALLAIPVLIHLLARQQSRRVLFPSLRFLPASQLAALRRRVLTDWPLLAVRMLIIATAVGALAGPVFVSDARRQMWDQRVARAIVVAGDSARLTSMIEEAEQGSFTAARFANEHLPDALRGAAEWLAQQPPAAREAVIIGDLREGFLERRDLDVLPPHVGLRFLPVVDEREVGTELQGIGELSPDTVGRFRMRVEPALEGTRVEYQRLDDAQLPPLRIVAAPTDQPVADALLRAVWREGVATSATGPAGTAMRDVLIAFEGAAVEAVNRTDDPGVDIDPEGEWARVLLSRLPDVRGEYVDRRLVIQVPMPVRDERAAETVARIVKLAYAEDFARWETRHISAATLASWSRPATGSRHDALPADEGDRRWFWGAALMLLGVEHLMRRKARHA